MSDKRKLQHESIIGLINYSVMCAKSCDVLKTHDDNLTQNEESCLRVCADKVKQTFSLQKEQFMKLSPQLQ